MHEWDRYTMVHEPVSSIGLMERAAHACTTWIMAHVPAGSSFKIFCGRGNNGGDGLAIARQLHEHGYNVDAYTLKGDRPGSADFEANAARWQKIAPLTILSSPEDFPALEKTDIVIDALVGTGLSEPLRGLTAELVQYINNVEIRVIAIDLPSGINTDGSSKENTVVHAQTTLTFQLYKLGLLLAENGPFIGHVEILDIGLHPGFLKARVFNQQLVDRPVIDEIYRPRKPYAHKGNFGHALLLAGSYGKMGAAVLAARACLHAGAGLLTTAIPRCGYNIMQTSVPEAMALPDTEEELLAHLPDGLDKYNVIGIGPGIGTAGPTKALLASLLENYKRPLVIDADALNCLAQEKELLEKLPPFSIFTPHPKEFDRLFGEQPNEMARIQTAQQQAREKNIIIVLKGAHTLVATPTGKSYFNSTGNAGMAKGGSGDVLTGIITALLAQQYPPVQAAILGVYLHGLAGDLAARAHSQEAMTATDLTVFLGAAFLQLKGPK
jgi:NAD(P)H-hydrate epimerase